VPGAEINDATLAYDELGSGGAPVVLLHAGITDRRMWDGCVEGLAARHRVVRYDLRGFGESTMPPGRYSHAADLLGLLDWLSIQRAALIGVSMSGGVAIDLTLEHPERVAALIPVASAVGGYQQWSQDMEDADAAIDEAIRVGDLDVANELEMRLWIDGPRRSPADVDPEFRARARALNAGVLARVGEQEPTEQARLDPPAISRLGEIRVPTLVVVGDADVEDVLVIGEQLTQRIPGARKAVLPDVAHLPPMEQPELFTRLALDFLDAAR